MNIPAVDWQRSIIVSGMPRRKNVSGRHSYISPPSLCSHHSRRRNILQNPMKALLVRNTIFATIVAILCTGAPVIASVVDERSNSHRLSAERRALRWGYLQGIPSRTRKELTGTKEWYPMPGLLRFSVRDESVSSRRARCGERLCVRALCFTATPTIQSSNEYFKGPCRTS